MNIDELEIEVEDLNDPITLEIPEVLNGVVDVKVDGESVVEGGIANINLSNFALISESGNSVLFSLSGGTLILEMYDKNGVLLSSTSALLPSGEAVTDIQLVGTDLVITKAGETETISLATLIEGLASETWVTSQITNEDTSVKEWVEDKDYATNTRVDEVEGDIPTKTSDLTNDSGFVTSSYHDDTKVDKVSGKGLSTNDFTNEYKDQVDENESNITSIETLIPNEATSSNKLADKDFVNSSIATNTAFFKGTYDIVDDLHLPVTATHTEVALALDGMIEDATNNDYAFVVIPDQVSQDVGEYDRYKFDSEEWAYEYALNNSSFTASQWASITSGITSGKVSEYDNHISNTTIHITSTERTNWNKQSDWAQATDTQIDFIKNKPAIRSGSGLNSVAEGGALPANVSGGYSHAEGYGTKTLGGYSHAEGLSSVANSAYSHAEGQNTTANSTATHTEGGFTIANSPYQHAQGKYNVSANNFIDMVGWGDSDTARKNISSLTTTGDLHLKGNVYESSNDNGTGGNRLATQTDLTTHATNTDIHTTLQEKSKWDNASKWNETTEFNTQYITTPQGVKNGYVEQLWGKSIVVNQGVNKENFTTQTINGVTFTPNGDGSISLSGTATNTGITYNCGAFTYIPNHIYFYQRNSDNNDEGIRFGNANYGRYDYSDGYRNEWRDTTTPFTGSTYIRIYDGVATNCTLKPQIIDLTKMFGSGNEPTLEQCKAMFKDYIPYTEGSIVSANYDKITTTKTFAEVDLGTLNWQIYNATPHHFQGKIDSKANGRTNLFTVNYTTVSQSAPANLTDKQATGSAVSGWIYICDEDYETQAEFKSAMSGVMLAYELATPQIIEYPISPRIYCLDGYGLSVGNVSNYIDFNEMKYYKNVGKRAYQSGDENNPNVVTDGTNTCYVLATPQVIDIGEYIPKFDIYNNEFELHNGGGFDIQAKSVINLSKLPR